MPQSIIRYRTKPDQALRISERLSDRGYRNKLIFRAFADDIMGFAPPLCCTEDDIDILDFAFIHR